MKLTIKDASWHRNGVGGVGFYAVLFEDADYPGETFVASLFDGDDRPNGLAAVYSIQRLLDPDQGVTFAAGNSWRGDVYEAALWPLLTDFLKTHGTNRIGPFGLPDVKRG